MNITFGDKQHCFGPWRPTLGRVFAKPIAFDCETTPIDKERPWLVPAYVLGAAFDGRHGYFVQREHVAEFFAIHRDVTVVAHNAPFDLAVVNALSPAIDIYDRVERNKVWDTQLLHRLYMLATEGHTASVAGQSSLEHCVETHLGTELPKDVVDAKGKSVRVSYGQWLGKPPAEIEPVYLDYLAKDVIATHLLYGRLRKQLKTLLAESNKTWGYISPEWLREVQQKWGVQTHRIQLRAAIVLKEITANGLHLDLARRETLAKKLEKELTRLEKSLRRHGYLASGKGSNKALQAIFQRLERGNRGLHYPRTESGMYKTSRDALQDLSDSVPFIKLLLEYREVGKLLGSFLGKMGKRVLHPSFNVLARSGRTTSFGEINAQNLPRNDKVRSCFVPSPGKVFISADYKTIELATLSQVCLSQFGLESKMAAAINAGRDLHTLVAARVMHKKRSEVTDDERAKAKPINFGKPGGMGDAAMRQYAKTSYGIVLSDAEVAALSTAWFELFPEMQKFLADASDAPMELARLLKLTPASHYAYTENRRFLDHPENEGREREPHPILGAMLIKAVKTATPRTKEGRLYSGDDVDYFWSRLEAKQQLLPKAAQTAVQRREPSPQLQRAVLSLVGRAGVFTLTGRLRANATYSARHNTVFQGLAADGAKLGLWQLWRAGYRIVNFIHDEVVIEVPAGSNLKRHAERIRSMMIAGMQLVVPDVKVDVSYAAAKRWYKAAKPVFDKSQRKLLPWSPAPRPGSKKQTVT